MMPNPTSARFSILLVACLSPVLLLGAGCSGRTSSSSAQAAAPDFNGVWSAPFTPDLSKALGHQPPFTAYGAARFAKEDEIDDPLTKCLPIGPARGIQAGIMPFQVVQTPAVFTIFSRTSTPSASFIPTGAAIPRT